MYHSAFTQSILTHQISGPLDMENCIRKPFVHSFIPQDIRWVSTTCQACWCQVLGPQQRRRLGPLNWTITWETPFPSSKWSVCEDGCLIVFLPCLCSPSQAYTVTLWKLEKCALSADIALGQKAWEVTQGLNFSSPHHLAKYLWSVPKLHNDLLQWPSGTWHSRGNLAWSFAWSQQNLHF